MVWSFRGRLRGESSQACRHGAAVAFSLALAACGSGDDAGPGVALSQSSVSCSTDIGIACPDTAMNAKVLTGKPDTRPTWQEDPQDGVTHVVDHLYRDQQADGSWALSFGFAPQLKPGSYAGSIEVSAPDPSVSYHAPVKISYTLQVSSQAGQMPTLKTISGAGDWQGTGGSGARNPYVPVALDASKFTRRWTQALSLDVPANGGYPPTTIAGGTVYLAGARPTGQAGNVWAMSEQDGSKLWSAALPGVPGSIAPVGSQVLIVADTTGTDGRVQADITSLGASTGVQAFRLGVPELAVPAQGVSVGAGPLILGQSAPGTIQAFNPADGSLSWSAVAAGYSGLLSYAGWGVAVDGQNAYTNIGGALRTFRLSDGSSVSSVDIPSRGGSLGNINRTTMNQVPVLADAKTVLSLTYLDSTEGDGADNQLSAVDIGAQSLLWTISGQFTTQPAAASGVIYVGNQATKQLEARSLATGALLWTWSLPDNSFRSQMVLTRSHLFLSTDQQTVALDLATHQAVWRYPLSGRLAMSSQGLLYIMGKVGPTATQGVLVAFNLQ